MIKFGGMLKIGILRSINNSFFTYIAIEYPIVGGNVMKPPISKIYLHKIDTIKSCSTVNVYAELTVFKRL